MFNTTTGAEQNSTTLKTNESAYFSEIAVNTGSDVSYYKADGTSTNAGSFTVKSSDESIVSVNKADNTFTAQGPGTATITITFGGATYTKTITVKNEKREATSVKVDKTSVAVVKTNDTTAKVQLLDQYGDPMNFDNADTTKEQLQVVSSNENVAKVTIANPVTTNNPKLDAVVTITGEDTGSAVITFRDKANAKLGSTSISASVTENGTVSQYSINADTSISDSDMDKLDDVVTGITKEQISTDATIDSNSDAYVKLNIKELNSAGSELGDAKAADYTVTTAVSKADVLDTVTTFNSGNATPKNGTSEQNGYILVKAGTKAGTATIKVTNDLNGKVVKTFTVTVTDVGYNVTGASFKNITAPDYATTLNYEDFLSYTEAGATYDPTINGLTLSKSTTQPVRLDLSTADLYIDKNGDGNYLLADGDIIVGSVAFGKSGTIAASISATTAVDSTGLPVTSMMMVQLSLKY